MSPSYGEIYDGSDVPRIDRFMTETAISHLSGYLSHSNEMVRQCTVPMDEFDRLMECGGQLLPMYL